MDHFFTFTSRGRLRQLYPTTPINTLHPVHPLSRWGVGGLESECTRGRVLVGGGWGGVAWVLLAIDLLPPWLSKKSLKKLFGKKKWAWNFIKFRIEILQKNLKDLKRITSHFFALFHFATMGVGGRQRGRLRQLHPTHPRPTLSPSYIRSLGWGGKGCSRANVRGQSVGRGWVGWSCLSRPRYRPPTPMVYQRNPFKNFFHIIFLQGNLL